MYIPEIWCYNSWEIYGTGVHSLSPLLAFSLKGLRSVMKAFFQELLKDSSVERVKEAFLAAGKVGMIYGMSGAAKHTVFSACYQEEPRPVVVVVHNREYLKAWREDLLALMPTVPVTELPETDVANIRAAAASGDTGARRMEALGRLARKEPGFVLAEITSLAQKDISCADFQRLSVSLRLGDEFGREKLLERLVSLGYEPTAEVERIGDYSLRGGIVDIFPINAANPIRVEFFDDEIDSLRSFDIETKRSVKNLAEATILPIAVGNNEVTSPVLSYLSEKATVIFDEPNRLIEELKRRKKENPELADHYFSWEEIVAAGGQSSEVFTALLPQKVAAVEPDELISVTVRQVAPYRQQLDMLAEDLGAWRKINASVVFFCGSEKKADALADILGSYGRPFARDNNPDSIGPDKAVITTRNISEGFELSGGRLILIAEKELFGRKRTARQRMNSANAGERIRHFRDIKVGDYIVHVNHGIGRYIGVKTMEVSGVKRDYLHIQYAGEDKLFVPTDQVQYLQKYIGAEGDTPKLSKISSQEWAKAKAKARASVEDIAQELLKLYAEREARGGIAFSPDTTWQQEFEEAFPFEETADQLRAIEEIKADMERAKPMERLLCGDVGFGKTEVAVRAAFKAVMSGYQVAVLVPTTVLAQQHYQTFSERFGDFGPVVDVVCRFRTAREQRQTLAKTAAGQVDVLIGTHAILNKKKVSFSKLGLLIVDEEQRFGVKQKEKIKALASGIDVLTLSATPIPRTLHMSLTGARDMSLIETPPADRYPIQTYVVEDSDELLASAIRRELQRGGQVYVVYNRVATIDKMRRRLLELVPEARIEIGHGQMGEDLLEGVMMDFYEGKFDVLLATSIVENGLDVANANTMIVYDADRFGLSQLYQMRGRVGRSSHMAFAYFVYRRDKVLTEQAEKRLMAMKEFAELGAGFRIAMRDLELRGAGNLLGAEQHGHIAGIGFEMYCQMLEEAINTLRGGKPAEVQPDPVLSLSVEAYIDGGYIDDAMHKIEIYQRIASLRRLDQIDYLLDELIDRFGEPTAPVMELLEVARVKIMARDLSIKNIMQKEDRLEIIFLPDPKCAGENIVALVNEFGYRAKLLPRDMLLRIKLTDKDTKDIMKFLKRVLNTLSGNKAEVK